MGASGVGSIIFIRPGSGSPSATNVVVLVVLPVVVRFSIP